MELLAIAVAVALDPVVIGGGLLVGALADRGWYIWPGCLVPPALAHVIVMQSQIASPAIHAIVTLFLLRYVCSLAAAFAVYYIRRSMR